MHLIFKKSIKINLKKGHQEFGNLPGKVVKLVWMKTEKECSGE
jgi:hypothetical protein